MIIRIIINKKEGADMASCTKQCLLLEKNEEDVFVKMIIQMLGPVLLGEKPSEIISFPKKEGVGLHRIKSIFDHCHKISYREFIAFNGCRKILFYNDNLLNETIRDQRNLNFLKKIGYRAEYNVQDYLDHLIGKIEKEHLPHEIGIFLGYPLKDVIGFMGHPALKLTKINGWNVYGDSRLSDEQYAKFNRAKQQIQRMLEENSPETIVQRAS